MNDLQYLVESLVSSDNTTAYHCLQLLEKGSYESDAVYPFFDVFVDMLDSNSSFIRIRAIVLIAANARWDVDHKLEACIGSYLSHVADDKPITARQCIQLLPMIAKSKPNLRKAIIHALQNASATQYKESMQALVAHDIQQSLQELQAEER